MCCSPRRHHHGAPMKMGGCCTPEMGGHMPSFWSKRKTIKALEKYLDELRDEIQDVEDYIKKLQEDK